MCGLRQHFVNQVSLALVDAYVYESATQNRRESLRPFRTSRVVEVVESFRQMSAGMSTGFVFRCTRSWPPRSLLIIWEALLFLHRLLYHPFVASQLPGGR